MRNEDIILITNRSVGSLVYEIPELHVRRVFSPAETKEISFEELKNLYSLAGGAEIIEQNLSIDNKEALSALNIEVEPEYFYTTDKIKSIMTQGSLDEFLDMLDFGPDGVKDIIKNLAVELPLNDVEKRDAIFEKLNFNVSKAIEIKNTRFDGGAEDTSNNSSKGKRRVAIEEEAAPATTAPKRRVISKAE